MLLKPGCQIPKAFGKGGETGFNVFGSSTGICDANTGVNPGFVNVQAAAIFPMDFEHGKPPVKHWEGLH